jgi:hypothetical protein
MRVAHAVEESLSVHLWSTSKNPLRRVLKWPDMNLKVYPRSEPPGSPRLGPNRTGRDRQSLCCKKREVNHDWAWLSLKFGDFHRFHLNSNRVYGFRRWKKYEEVGLIICLRRKSWRNYRLQPLKLMSLSSAEIWVVLLRFSCLFPPQHPRTFPDIQPSRSWWHEPRIILAVVDLVWCHVVSLQKICLNSKNGLILHMFDLLYRYYFEI